MKAKDVLCICLGMFAGLMAGILFPFDPPISYVWSACVSFIATWCALEAFA